MSAAQLSDLPFRLEAHKILVVKDTPAHVCGSCGEVMLPDTVMKRIDQIINRIRDREAELEVVRYAA
jgi:YgiT-type zinc finger domain-containing protein